MKYNKYIIILLVFFLISGIAVRFDFKNRPIRFDQGLYAYTTNQINSPSITYLSILSEKPPLAYAYYNLFFKLFGNKASTLFLIGIISDVLIILLIFLIVSNIYNKKTALLSSAMYSVSYLAFNFSWGGFLEIPMMVFVLLSVFLYLIGIKQKSSSILFLSGIFIGVSFLIKQPGIIIIITFLAHLITLFRNSRLQLKEFLKYALSISAGLATVFLFFIIYLVKLNILIKYIYVVLYVSTIYGPSFYYKIKLIVNIIFAGIPFLTLLSLITLHTTTKKLDKKNSFLLLWLIPIILFFIFTKDFQPHYLVQLIPVLVIIISSGFYIKHTSNKFIYLRLLLIILFFIYSTFLIIADLYSHHKLDRHYISVGFLNNEYMLNYEQDTWVNLNMQKNVAEFIVNNTNSNDKIITTNPTYAYLANKTNNYRFAWVSPMTIKLSSNLKDFGLYASQSKYLIYDFWEEQNLDKENKFLSCVKQNWKLVREASNKYIIVYENTNKTACVAATR